MTTYYKVLRPVGPADLNTSPMLVEVLRMIPSEGYVKCDHFKSMGTGRASKGLTHARSKGMLRRVSPHERVMKMESVRFWCTQFHGSGHKNTVPTHGTRELYLRAITKLNKWLPGRTFQSYETVISGGQITRQSITKSFANVEELMEYCNTSDYGTRTAQRAIREYLANQHTHNISGSLYASMRSAIKSYFNANDIVLDLPRSRKKRTDSTTSGDSMTLEDFYRMLQTGNPGIKMKTIMLIKLQSGMDSSTFTDRFNYEGYLHSNRTKDSDKFSKKLLHTAGKIDIVCIL